MAGGRSEGEEAVAVAVEVGDRIEQGGRGDDAVEPAQCGAASSTRLTPNRMKVVASQRNCRPPSEGVGKGRGVAPPPLEPRQGAIDSKAPPAPIRTSPPSSAEEQGVCQLRRRGCGRSGLIVSLKRPVLIFGDQHREPAAADEEGEVERQGFYVVAPAVEPPHQPVEEVKRGRGRAGDYREEPISSGVSKARLPKPPPNRHICARPVPARRSG